MSAGHPTRAEVSTSARFAMQKRGTGSAWNWRGRSRGPGAAGITESVTCPIASISDSRWIQSHTPAAIVVPARRAPRLTQGGRAGDTRGDVRAQA